MEGIQHRIVIVVVKHRKKTETSAAKQNTGLKDKSKSIETHLENLSPQANQTQLNK